MLKKILSVTLLLLAMIPAQAQFNTDRITAIGRNALYFEDYILSIQYFNQVIRVKPYLAEPYQLRAIAKVQLGDYNSAMSDVERAIALNPFQHAFYYTRSFIYSRTDRDSLALQDLGHALFLAPGNTTYLLMRAGVLAQRDSFELAERDLNHLLIREPKRARHWSMLGMVRLAQGQDSSAVVALDKAMYYGSRYSGDYINRGLAHYHLLHYPEALNDYTMALELDSTNTHLRYALGQLRLEVGLYNRAKADFDTLIVHYPTFLPAYYLAAEALDHIGAKDSANVYRKRARVLEHQQRAMSGSKADSLALLFMGIAPGQEEAAPTRLSTSAADAVSQPNITLSYYGQTNPTTSTCFYHPLLNDCNRAAFLPATLRFSTNELSLSADMIDQHFRQIANLTADIDALRPMGEPERNVWSRLSRLFFARAIEYALVQDYVSAIDDCTQALRFSDPQLTGGVDHVIATFCRANWRFRLLEYRRGTGDKTLASPLDFEIMLRDYDYCIAHAPDFAFAFYNKANLMIIQRQYGSAIELYSQAIAVDPLFAEAYFNRALTYLTLSNKSDQSESENRTYRESALADLSRAGELGLSQAYNLLSSLNK